jgi:general L-amino acid transport system permease protein
MATQTRTLEPIPTPPEPPARAVSAREWARTNLFSNRWNTLLTLVFGALLAWVLFRFAWFVLVDARWEIARRNLTNVLVFRYPRDELWRLWAALFVLAASVGLGSGVAARVRRAQVEEGLAPPRERRLALRRAGPLVALVLVLLWLAGDLEATLLTLGIAAVGGLFHLAGRRVPPARTRAAAVAVLAGFALAYLVITAFGGVGWDRWGGLLLTVFLAVAGIVLSFPLGVLLALGRRSSFPAVRFVCTAYIELIRGVPLITLLFMSAFMLGFFLPPGMERPSAVTRALVALVLFTAAYVAEIVRGGLQSVPRGQIEAAKVLGLTAGQTMRRIVLPQAIRVVLPPLANDFVTLIKFSSLASTFAVGEITRKATELTAFTFRPMEIFTFVALVYFFICWPLSLSVRYAERRLTVA